MMKNIEKTELVKVVEVTERRPIIIFMGITYRVPEGLSKGEYMKELRAGI